MSKRFNLRLIALLIVLAVALVLAVESGWASNWKSPLVTGADVNATYQWKLIWDESPRQGIYPSGDVYLSVDGRRQPLSGGSPAPIVTAEIANPGKHAALDIGVVYGGRFGAVGQTVSFPWPLADGFFAPYEVTFLANRWVSVGDEPVLLMRLEHAMEIIESHSPTSVPRAVELWARREFPTLQ
jgi:hypothetical protein